MVSAADGDYNHVYDDNDEQEDKDGEIDDRDANVQDKTSAVTSKIYHHLIHTGILHHLVEC